MRDSLVAAVHDLGDPSVYEREFDSYGEALIAEIATLRASADEAARWAIEHVEVRPGFHELVDRFDPVIVSSGLPQLILPVLGREGVELDVRSNFADPSPHGWRVRFRHEGPCPVCGDRCKRRSLPDEHPLVFVGDGYSDRCAAQAADRIFARDGLASYLDERGVSYERFDDFYDVDRAL